VNIRKKGNHMNILILGGDGYLGWPTAMHFSARGDKVMVVDNFAKRRWELEEGIEPLIPVVTLQRRVRRWYEITGKQIEFRIGDLCNHRFVYSLLETFRPDAIIHYGQQPSAPYSMQSRETAVYSQTNNVVGNMNVLFAMQKYCPDSHLVKLGTMGEYGQPNIDIEEGWLNITHNGRTDRMLYPKKPGSFYHISKVHDSNNIEFTCRVWGTRATDLNQGVVYGIDTDHTQLDPAFGTSFHYDDVFGTVLNRFLVQAAVGAPLTVYGKGDQTRGFLNIRDTINCVSLAVDCPAEKGEFRVLNQFTEQFSVNDLAIMVKAAGNRAGRKVEITHLPNPRIELESHYYNAKHSALEDLGLKPNLLTDEVLDQMLTRVCANSSEVDNTVFLPRIRWRA
jgi:UDP-sulfoquinovose synthase